MGTLTARLALTKPDTTDAVDVSVLNTDFDRLDARMSCISVLDGTIDSNIPLFDGAIVREKTSGIIWEARKNGGGTYDRIYIRYPYYFYAYTATNNYAISGTAFNTFGWASFYATEAKNSSAAHLTAGGFWQCPIKGVYQIRIRNWWAANGTGYRASAMAIGGTINYTNGCIVQPHNSASHEVGISLSDTRVFNAGDVVSNHVWQDSGGALNLDTNVAITMIEPLQ